MDASGFNQSGEQPIFFLQEPQGLTEFRDVSILHHQHPVAVHDGLQTMGDCDNCPVSKVLSHSLLYDPIYS
mgnify:CR=1 FL=1